MGQGYCPFHCTNVAKLESHYDTCNDSNLVEQQLGVSIGEQYLWYPNILPVTFTGDGGPVSNVLYNIAALLLCFIQVLALGDQISQSIYCGACVLISSLSESDSRLTPTIQMVGSTLNQSGILAIKCTASNVWVCVQYKRFNIADWKFAFTHFNLSVGVSAPYSMIELCSWNDGVPCGVSEYDYYDCLMQEYIDPWLPNDYEYCSDNNFTGLLLSDSTVLQHWGQETDTLMDNFKQVDAQNDNLQCWDDPKWERQERVRVAQHETENGHGILTSMLVALEPALVDVAHGFWSFMGMYVYVCFYHV